MTIKTGEKMYANDMLNLLFFPKGMILMYDGTSWQDNVSLKGWYQCAGQETPYGKTPDLRDKFLMGYNGTRSGGNNSLSLTKDNLPAHNHSLNNMSLTGLSMEKSGGHEHAGTGKTTDGGGAHPHDVSGSTSDTSKELTGTWHGVENLPYYATETSGIVGLLQDGHVRGGTSGWDGNNDRYSIDVRHSHNITGSTSTGSGGHTHDVNVSIPESGSHTHTISGGTISGSVGDAGSGTAFDNRPSYYALIYIIKMTAAGE